MSIKSPFYPNKSEHKFTIYLARLKLRILLSGIPIVRSATPDSNIRSSQPGTSGQRTHLCGQCYQQQSSIQNMRVRYKLVHPEAQFTILCLKDAILVTIKLLQSQNNLSNRFRNNVLASHDCCFKCSVLFISVQ